jgi:hypothetical protein
LDHEEQLSWEERVGRPVAIAAFAAAVLLLAAIVYSSATIKESANDSVDQMFVLHRHKGPFIVGSLFQGISQALFAPVLWLLYRVVRYRREQIPPIARYLAMVAPVASGILFFISRIQIASVSDKVVKTLTANPTVPKAANDYVKHQLTAGNLQLVGGLGLAAGLGMALALVLICVNAMRAGVLSRFMGVLGIIVGVLLVLPIFGNIPFIQIFWVGAIGLLFLGRWPQGGRGPAWETGEPIPWPTAADRQAQIAEAKAEREAARDDVPERAPVAAGRRGAAEPADDDGAAPARRQAAQHPRPRKRKRKRR